MGGCLLKNNGSTIIESILFFIIVIFIVQYSCILVHSLNHLEINNYDKKYEEAYK